MGLKILTVDDSKTILKLNSRIISNVLPDSEVFPYEFPLKAVEDISEKKITFDLAILDYNMEGMNGIELAQALINLKPSPLTNNQIWIVSANIQDAVTDRAKQMGFEFIPKPFDEAKLKDILAKREK